MTHEYEWDEIEIVVKEDYLKLKRKAKAFDTFLQYKKHVEKYNNSDCHELEKAFEFVMKEYEEDE